jgi:hypothetical protein
VLASLLVPVLYPQLFLVLAALRPSRGALLARAIVACDGGVSLPAMVAVAIPLQLRWVWLYFLLGKAWQAEIDTDSKPQFVTAGLLQPGQVWRRWERLRACGAWFIILARFAIFPTGTLAAAGGAADLRPRRSSRPPRCRCWLPAHWWSAPVTAWAWHSANPASGSWWAAWLGWWPCPACSPGTPRAARTDGPGRSAFPAGRPAG